MRWVNLHYLILDFAEPAEAARENALWLCVMLLERGRRFCRLIRIGPPKPGTSLFPPEPQFAVLNAVFQAAAAGWNANEGRTRGGANDGAAYYKECLRFFCRMRSAHQS